MAAMTEMTKAVAVMHKPVIYYEQITEMITSHVQDEINRLFIDWMYVMAADGKIGMVYGNCKRIYDFNMGIVITRCRA